MKLAVPLVAALCCAGLPSGVMAEGQGEPLTLRKRALDGVPYVENWAAQHVVRGLRASGDGFLSVRSGPATGFAERDRLANGRTVTVFERRGEWAGVVYTPRPDNDVEAVAKACGFDETAARAMAARKTYDGPCAWGWVNRRWLIALTD